MDAKEQELIEASNEAYRKWCKADSKMVEASREMVETTRKRGKAYREMAETNRKLQEYRNNKAQ